MNTRFAIKLSSQVPCAGLNYCELGYPNPAYMQNNICIIEKGNLGNKIEINNNVLREALLSDKEFCLKYLGLKIYDQSEQPEKVVEKVVVKTKVVKEKSSTKKKLDGYIIVDDQLVEKYPSLKNKLGQEIDSSILNTVKPKED